MRKIVAVAALVATVVVVPGCADDPSKPPTGNLSVYLTDAPIDLDGVSAIDVTFTELVLVPVGEEPDGEIAMDLAPITLPGGGTINLLDYRDGEVVLMASEDVPAGDYAKLRMRIESAQVARDDDGDPETPDLIEPVFVPSGKVDVPVPFTLGGGEVMEVTLDFDAELSIHLNETPGGYPYILRPVINVAAIH